MKQSMTSFSQASITVLQITKLAQVVTIKNKVLEAGLVKQTL